jgi:hypothetical protein
MTADERELLISVADIIHKLARILSLAPADVAILEQLLRRVKQHTDSVTLQD